jgi:hypothetical protein
MSKENMLRVAQQVQERFEASMKGVADRIANEFPGVRPRVSSFVTESGVNPTHVLSLECQFPAARSDQPDLVALCITTEHLNRQPQTNVDISWGDPSGRIEAELFDQPMDFSNGTLRKIEDGLPNLYQILVDVVRKTIVR